MWPKAQREFLEQALPRLKGDPRLLGVAVGGSSAWREMEEFSHLHLLLVCNPISYHQLREAQHELAESLGSKLVSFVGDEGEPGPQPEDGERLVNLYDDPFLRVDLKIMSLADFSHRRENPEILWERDEVLSKARWDSKPSHTHPDLQWMEDRFWVWLHYGAHSLGRGEIFEAMDLLSRLRTQVLGPLIHWKQGRPAQGVRRIEQCGGEYLSSLRATVPIYDARSCELSLRESAKLYVDLRENLATAGLVRHRRTEMACMRHLHDVSERFISPKVDGARSSSSTLPPGSFLQHGSQ